MGINFSCFILEKVIVVFGDIICEDLGIKEFELKEELLRDIDVIVNFVVIINFDERYIVISNK